MAVTVLLFVFLLLCGLPGCGEKNAGSGPVEKEENVSSYPGFKVDAEAERLSEFIALREDPARAKEALGEIMAALKDRDPRVRSAAAEILVMLGPQAARAAAVLRDALGDEDVGVRISAVRALEKIGPETLEGALVELIDSLDFPDRDWRLYVTVPIAEMGSKAAAALPKLRKLAEDPDRRVQKIATWAISNIEGKASR